MPKQIINPKMNMQNLVILAIFLIGSLILYRMIIGVKTQCIALKNDFEALRMTQTKKQNNSVVNVFEKNSPVHNDDTISVNSEDIDTILRKINSEPEKTENMSTEGCITEAHDNDEEVQSQIRVINTNDKEIFKVIDDEKNGNDDNNDNNDNNDDEFHVDTLEEYTEESLKKKQLGELKSILKKQNKLVKGNKSDLIKTILE